MKKIDTLLVENKSLFWDVKDISSLDQIAIEERFFHYGDWRNIQDLVQIYGMDALKSDYIVIRDKTRCNLPKKTVNFFNLYFHV